MTHLVDLNTMLETDRSILQERFPSTSFPADPYITDELLKDFGFATFTVDDRPSSSPFYHVLPGPIVKDEDGLYRMHWIIEDMDLEQCKNSLLNLVQQQKQIALTTTVTFNDFEVPLDWNTVTMLREGAYNPNPIVLRGVDGWLSLSSTDATALASKISAALLSISSNENAHYVAIRSLTDTETAKAYDVTTGWPK